MRIVWKGNCKTSEKAGCATNLLCVRLIIKKIQISVNFGNCIDRSQLMMKARSLQHSNQYSSKEQTFPAWEALKNADPYTVRFQQINRKCICICWMSLLESTIAWTSLLIFLYWLNILCTQLFLYRSLVKGTIDCSLRSLSNWKKHGIMSRPKSALMQSQHVIIQSWRGRPGDGEGDMKSYSLV